MKTVTKPEIDLWFDPPEMDEETKAEVLRAALDEAWESDARGESLMLTSEETYDLIKAIGRQVEREFAEREKAEAAVA